MHINKDCVTECGRILPNCTKSTNSYVALRFRRDDERVGSIYNDDGTDRTMARLTTARDGTDFIGVEVPEEFVAELLDAAAEAGRVTDEAAIEGYRLRVL